MKWILMFLTLSLRQLNTRLRGPSLRQTLMDIFYEAREKSKKLANLIIGGIAATIFFCGGFFIALINLSAQWDQSRQIAWSATLISGLVLMGLALIVYIGLYASFTKDDREEVLAERDEKKKKERLQRSSRRYAQAPRSESASSLEGALAALVMDFIHERQSKRDFREQRFSANEPGPFSQNRPESEDDLSRRERKHFH